MGMIIGQHEPTNTTVGAIGDIYRCEKTKELYECVFSYRPNSLSDYIYEWRKLRKEDIEDRGIEIEEGDLIEPINENQSMDINRNNRTDYTKYSKNKHVNKDNYIKGNRNE